MHETSVVRIEYSFKEYDLYDIQVEETECFVANDVLVHNCGIIDDPVKIVLSRIANISKAFV